MWRVISWCCLGFMLAAPAGAQLQNGDFVQWEAGAGPKAWTFWSEAKGEARVTRWEEADGAVCARVHLPRQDFVALQQYAAAQAGATYRLTFRARGAFFGTTALNVEAGRGGGVFDLGPGMDLQRGWRMYEFDVTAGDKPVIGIGFRFQGKGVVWIDDVQLTLRSATRAPAGTAVVMPSYFSDAMVLQREREIPIWGWAPPEVAVTVKLGEETREAQADASGEWRTVFAARAAGGPVELAVTSADTALRFKDVKFGDVWVCAGQSNMQHPMTQVLDAEKEIAAADCAEIRLLTMPMTLAGTPQDDALHNGWVVCSPKNVGAFSAVAYFYGRQLQERLQVPIGLVNCAWFGTSIIGWTSERAYGQAPPEIQQHFAKFLAQVDKAFPDWRRRMGEFHYRNALDQDEFQRQLAAWRAETAKEKAAGRVPGPEPLAPAGRPFTDSTPTGIYNGMVHPLTRMPIKGVVWYQGESDAPRAAEYAEHLALNVRDWREAWGQGEFPFLFVQIAWCKWWGPTWAAQCEAQLRAARMIPNSALVVINDLHDNYDQHPRKKRAVADRLALAARRVVYGEADVEYQGPLYQAMEVRGGKAVLEFAHTLGKLTAEAPQALTGFTVAGADRVFHPGEAVVEGEKLVVWSKEVATPAAVRWNWGNAEPVCAIFNERGLPMSAFRTDEWPLK